MGAFVGEKNFGVIKMHGTTIKKNEKHMSHLRAVGGQKLQFLNAQHVLHVDNHWA